MSGFSLASKTPSCDVDVLLAGGRIVCRNCIIEGCSVHADASSAFRHFMRHVDAGHRVRRAVLEGLAVASAVSQEVTP